MPITPYPSRIPSMNQYANLQREVRENSQQDLYETPSSFPMKSLPDILRPARLSSPNYDNNPFLAQLQKNEAPLDATTTSAGGIARGEHIPPRSGMQRSSMQQPFAHSTENLSSDAQRAMRPRHLVTDSLLKEGQLHPYSMPSSLPLSSIPARPKFALSPLAPGTLLRAGRYRLRELQERQDWLEGVFEAMWIAQDAQRSGSQVMICELVTPDSKSMVMQSTLRNATMALTSVGRHPHILTLWDAFSDQGHSFFVFEPIEGETLAAHMRRTGHVFPEQDAVECCLQMTEILEVLLQQSPPLVHGFIRPEHIVMKRMGSEYILTNFSIVLASGATQYVSNVNHSALSPYTAPEAKRGIIDVHSDLYSLLATAYHMVTGSIPANLGDKIPPRAQRLNSTISSKFDAILARGLHPVPTQRYLRLSELRQDLLAMRSVSGTVSSRNGQLAEPQLVKQEQPTSTQRTNATQPMPPNPNNSLSQILPSMLASGIVDDQEKKMLLPRPEELTPIPERNDSQQAMFWLVGILLCLALIVIVSRGLM